ncbi:MAG: FadR/GntR family transcriptional regulator [Oscillospiraceae bacterium]|nr:FadR/GntR family transcriptional regulator [Oscillospiraceae bacterium]
MAKKKEKGNVTDTVYSQMFGRIISGIYKPGDRIASENELSEMYGVSRNTIRMALNRLSTLGLLEIRRGEGSFVKKVGINMYLNSFIPAVLIHEESLMDLMEFRRGIEVSAARLAAIKADEKDIKAIKDALNYTDLSLSSNRSDFANSTMSFHTSVVRASKNEIFIMMFDIIRHILTSKMQNFLEYQKFNIDSPYFHRMVYEAIAAHEPVAAEFMMGQHMVSLIGKVESFNNYLKEHPDASLSGAPKEEAAAN